MTITQVAIHYIFMSWFAWSTFCRLTMINKNFHWSIRGAMAALGICAFAALFIPTYLRAIGESWSDMSDVMLWLYIALGMSGAVAQAVFASLWISKHPHKIPPNSNVTSIVLEDVLRRRRA